MYSKYVCHQICVTPAFFNCIKVTKSLPVQKVNRTHFSHSHAGTWAVYTPKLISGNQAHFQPVLYIAPKFSELLYLVPNLDTSVVIKL